mmetsp:Transcript_29408/g.53335  ORF Transcript_29408/g.53335 Transcript_29408/m.53335 type:complete len:234 (+) Transcript_29408:159-860(+)
MIFSRTHRIHATIIMMLNHQRRSLSRAGVEITKVTRCRRRLPANATGRGNAAQRTTHDAVARRGCPACRDRVHAPITAAKRGTTHANSDAPSGQLFFAHGRKGRGGTANNSHTVSSGSVGGAIMAVNVLKRRRGIVGGAIMAVNVLKRSHRTGGVSKVLKGSHGSSLRLKLRVMMRLLLRLRFNLIKRGVAERVATLTLWTLRRRNGLLLCAIVMTVTVKAAVVTAVAAGLCD